MMLSISQMAADIGVPPDLIRAHCRNGNIPGAMNAGTGSKTYWRVPSESWEAFKRARTAKQNAERASLGRTIRRIADFNHIGI